MCGRYYIDDDTAREIQKLVRQIEKSSTESNLLLKSGDIHPSNAAPILAANGTSLCCRLQKWGFPGFGSANRQLIFNARSESALTKPLFRESILYRRIVVPAAWFYEWNANKEKNIFYKESSPILFMAGCFNRYADGDHFVILTTKANASMEPVHDRMPLILDQDDITEWIFNFQKIEQFLSKEPCLLNRRSEYEQLSIF